MWAVRSLRWPLAHLDNPFVKAFTGRTKEGIGMESTREEVIASHGEPTASSKMTVKLDSLQ